MENSYFVFVQVDPNNLSCLGGSLDREQAFAIARNFLSQNPAFKSEQIIINEYSLQKQLKILDYQPK